MTEQQTETDNRQEDGGKKGQNTKKNPEDLSTATK